MSSTPVFSHQDFEIIGLFPQQGNNPVPCEMNQDFSFLSLHILENLNQFPYFILKLDARSASGEKQNLMSSITDFYLACRSTKPGEATQAQDFSLTLGIDTFSYDATEKIYKYEGWLTKQENFRIPRTRYLDNNAKKAIQILNIVPESALIMDDNCQDQFFQINQTNAETALSICRYAAKTPFWSVGLNAINLNPVAYTAEDFPDYSPLVLGQNLYAVSNPYFSNWKLSGSQLGYMTDFSGGNYIQAFGTPDIYRIATNEQSTKYESIIPEQFIKSGFNASVLYRTETEFPFPLGTMLSEGLLTVNNVDSWVVAGIYRHYSNQQKDEPQIFNEVQFIGVPESLEL